MMSMSSAYGPGSSRSGPTGPACCGCRRRHPHPGPTQVVAVHAAGAGGRVAGERHAGAGVLAGVAEDHRLHVDRGAQVAGDALLAAVQLGAQGVPGTEHRLDRTEQLFAGSCGKCAPCEVMISS